MSARDTTAQGEGAPPGPMQTIEAILDPKTFMVETLDGPRYPKPIAKDTAFEVGRGQLMFYAAPPNEEFKHAVIESATGIHKGRPTRCVETVLNGKSVHRTLTIAGLSNDVYKPMTKQIAVTLNITGRHAIRFSCGPDQTSVSVGSYMDIRHPTPIDVKADPHEYCMSPAGAIYPELFVIGSKNDSLVTVWDDANINRGIAAPTATEKGFTAYETAAINKQLGDAGLFGNLYAHWIAIVAPYVACREIAKAVRALMHLSNESLDRAASVADNRAVAKTTGLIADYIRRFGCNTVHRRTFLAVTSGDKDKDIDVLIVGT